MENKYITFDREVGAAISKSDDYILLAYFVTDTRYNINEVLLDLESVANEEKTFEDIHDPQVYWSFGNGEGYFECDKDTAYFINDGEWNYPDIEMPLSELIEILKEWKVFLGK